MRTNRGLSPLVACFWIVGCITLGLLVPPVVSAQAYRGEVTGMLTAGVNKYNGEFTDDLWGAGGFASIQYAPLKRLHLEARFGLGEIRWKITPTDLAKYPAYFGPRARLGSRYPGTFSTIESESESRVSTVDLMMHWVVVDHLPAIPFISFGLGWINYAPSNAGEHDALPNFSRGVYSGNAISIPLGAGVRIPMSDRVDLVVRGEHRFVFSRYLDDINANGRNDAMSSVTVGLAYQFTQPRHTEHAHLQMEEHRTAPSTSSRAPETAPNVDTQEVPTQEVPQNTPAQPSEQVTENATDSATEAPTEAPQQEPAVETAEQPAPSAPASLECPPGFARLCADSGLGVCVDTMFTPGRSRIKWEQGMIYDPSAPDHLQMLGDQSAENPCYAIVVREVEDAYYLCIDCCFVRTVLGETTIYNVQENTGRYAKGTGAFEPADCVDCVSSTTR